MVLITPGSIDEAVTFGGQGSLDVGYAVAPLSDGSALVMGSYGGPFMVDGKKVLETQLSEGTHDYVRKTFIFKLRL